VQVHSAESLASELQAAGYVDVVVEIDERVHMLLSAEVQSMGQSEKDTYAVTAKPTCFRATKPT
jgi:hypothetical protein